MDDRFFMYGEDIDLSRRIAECYTNVYYPEVEVVHTHGAASKKSLKMFKIHFVNVFTYFMKWGWFYDPKRDELNERYGEKVALKG